VLLDIQMPAMNGYEALSAMRDWEKKRGKSQVPILALTAFALKEEAEKCLAAGFGAHITKPIRRDDLIKTIKQYAA
jgi:CheY-like chemotaxis protein